MIYQCMYIMCNDQIWVIDTSITPNIYRFFVLGAKSSTATLKYIVIAVNYRMLEVIPPVQLFHGVCGYVLLQTAESWTDPHLSRNSVHQTMKGLPLSQVLILVHSVEDNDKLVSSHLPTPGSSGIEQSITLQKQL